MAPRTPPSPPANDFDPYALTKQVDDHARDMAAITKRLDDLDAKFGTHEKIANTLCETSATAVKMRQMMADTFVVLIESDQKIKDALIYLVNKTDRHWFYSYAKKIGFTTWSVILLIIGAIAKSAADHLLTK